MQIFYLIVVLLYILVEKDTLQSAFTLHCLDQITRTFGPLAWFFAHLFVTVAAPKLLPFGKTQINLTSGLIYLVFRSLIRNFAENNIALANHETDNRL